MMKKIQLIIGVLYFVSNVNIAIAQACDLDRRMITENLRYFTFAPKFLMGTDSLIQVVNSQLNGTKVADDESGTEVIEVVLKINSKGAMTEIVVFADSPFRSILKQKLEAIFNKKNQWCPGFSFDKKNRRRELLKEGVVRFELRTVNGLFAYTSADF